MRAGVILQRSRSSARFEKILLEYLVEAINFRSLDREGWAG